MIGFRMPLLAGMLLVGTVAAHATWFTTEASFLSAMNSSFYLEDFNGFGSGSPLNGSQTTYAGTGANGFNWTASAPHGLFSNPGALSTNQAGDPITFTFSGNQVSAFGAMVANTNASGTLIAGTVTITLSDSTTNNVVFSSGTQGFLGWVGSTPFASVAISSTSGATLNYPQVDHVYTSSAPVPEPMTMTGLAMGALVLLRRRKKA